MLTTRPSVFALGLALLWCVGPLAVEAAWPNQVRSQSKPRAATSQGMIELRREYAKAMESICIVKGKNGLGSGFVVAPGLVATNAHVVDGEVIEAVTVRFISTNDPVGESQKVQLLFEDKQRDVAILRVPTTRKPLKLTTSAESYEGRKVVVIGNSGLGTPEDGGIVARVNAVQEGTLTEAAMWHGQPAYRLEVPVGLGLVYHGNSGGPVLDAKTKEVVGVLFAGLARDLKSRRGVEKGTAFSIPVHFLSEICQKVGDKNEWDKLTKEATARHTLKLVIDEFCHLNSLEALLKAKAYELAGRPQQYLRDSSGRSVTAEHANEAYAELESELQTDAKHCRKILNADRSLSTVPRNLAIECIDNWSALAAMLHQAKGNAIAYDRKATNLIKKQKQLRSKLEKFVEKGSE